tara:strand:+ start:427 stop:837 length:411 start_codon:yes stop_codon:yes gene_type:complete
MSTEESEDYFIGSTHEDELKSRKIIGHQIKMHRKRLGLTQHGLASLSRVSRVNISRYEIGSTPARISHIKRLAEGLGVTVNDLLEDSTYQEEIPPTSAQTVAECMRQCRRIEAALRAIQDSLEGLVQEPPEAPLEK